jgi:hypothetical protein
MRATSSYRHAVAMLERADLAENVVRERRLERSGSICFPITRAAITMKSQSIEITQPVSREGYQTLRAI